MDKKRLRRLKKANRLQRLTPEQKQQPHLVFADFFDTFHLPDIRKELWEWLYSALCNPNYYHEPSQTPGNLLFLYEQLEKLTEAAFVLHLAHLSKQPSKTSK